MTEQKNQSIRDYLKEEKLLFDGGMGTYFAEKHKVFRQSCEEANLTQPSLIGDIHREYVKAGAMAIKTNTFSANRLHFSEEQAGAIIKAGWEIAESVAKESGVYVFADIGPLGGISENTTEADEYLFSVREFLKLGAKHFLFETNSNPEGLVEAAAYIREQEPESFIIASYAVQPDGFSKDGIYAQDLIDAVKDHVDAVGFNCVTGARHMQELIQTLDLEGITVSLMPNAGYPIVLRNRTFYEGDPVYYAGQLAEMAEEGAAIVGGCCGTTPLHISYASELLQKIRPEKSQKTRVKEKTHTEDFIMSPFWEKLRRGETVIAVELDPPQNVHLAGFMSSAWQVKAAGADLITIADCPIARARMDSSLLACKIRRELDMDAMPHMTCRDRNLNATKALLMGSYAEGIRNVLLVTGDPIPDAERDEVKSVYQFNSRKMAGYVSALNRQELPSPIHMFGALNVNAKNFDVQLRLAKQKQEKGIVGFLTQPVLTEEAFENLKRAREELSGYILGGIIPVISANNARYMNSEVNGIRVEQSIIDRYEGQPKAKCEELAVEISLEIAEKIRPYVDGFYLMTVLNRTGIIKKIIEKL